jgi:serine/threonine protein kinase
LKDGTNTEERLELMKEATVTAQFQNPHVVMIIGVVTVGNPLMLVIQLCENGSLNSFLKEEKRSPQLKVTFSLDISSGMKYLISLGFIHRDLAARNVLVSWAHTPAQELRFL